MGIILLNDKVSLASQIAVSDIEAIAHRGYQQIICNRPDEESEDHPRFKDIKLEAEKRGVEAIYLPVVGSQFLPNIIKGADEALNTDKKTLMYCYSGMRSGILWAINAITNNKGMPDEIFQTLARNGCDVSAFQSFIMSAAFDSSPELTLE